MFLRYLIPAMMNHAIPETIKKRGTAPGSSSTTIIYISSKKPAAATVSDALLPRLNLVSYSGFIPVFAS